MRPGPARLHAVPLALATVALAISGCSDDEDDAPNVGDLEVTDVQELDLPFGDAFLAPNGERIATYTEDELCVYSAEGEQQRCVDRELALDANSIRWNAEGTRLLFTENFFEYLYEPDVWMLDAESGDVTNLTDDGVDESGPDLMTDPEDGEPAADIDTVPVWADDETVRFLRWHRSEDEESTVEVMEVPADGGDPESVGDLATGTAPIDIGYTPDGRAVYARADQEDVALSDLSGEDVRSISDDTTSLFSVSDSGEDLLVMPNPAAASYSADWPAVTVVPVDGGEPTEIADSVRWATWRSGSEGIVYASMDVDDPRTTTLHLLADADSESRNVSTGSYLAPYRGASWRSPVWSTQDTILLMQENDSGDSADGGEPFQYVLLHLGTG